jgi:hypothetical protein
MIRNLVNFLCQEKSSGFHTIRHVMLVRKGVLMPTGPRGEKRPADAIGCAVMVGRLATGEITEILTEPSGKVRSGKAGSKARSANLTQEERTAIAKKAAAVRWG